MLPGVEGRLLYDVSHNICKEEVHSVRGRARHLHVHRKGATRAFGPGHADVPEALRAPGQPVLIGGSMGTASYVLAGTATGEALSWNSACHGAGRSMSRHQATRQWRGRQLVDGTGGARHPDPQPVAARRRGGSAGRLQERRARGGGGGAGGLARRVARLEPLVCVKG